VITSQLPIPVDLYRMNVPRYASTPLSGAGAARGGGRFNRPGLEALYLSLEPATAVAEFQQSSPHLLPATICSYTASVPPLVDLRQLGVGAWDPIWQDWNVDWRLIQVDGHFDPPTWDMADLALDAGVPGIIFPSMGCPGGTSVALFLEAFRGKGTIGVNDPSGTLPHNQASWI
jgi:RES domain-containing protein